MAPSVPALPRPWARRTRTAHSRADLPGPERRALWRAAPADIRGSSRRRTSQESSGERTAPRAARYPTTRPWWTSSWPRGGFRRSTSEQPRRRSRVPLPEAEPAHASRPLIDCWLRKTSRAKTDYLPEGPVARSSGTRRGRGHGRTVNPRRARGCPELADLCPPRPRRPSAGSRVY
jgi:hypothetical protein